VTSSFTARTAFPEQDTFPSEGRILAFNAVYEGHAIPAHVYGHEPVPISRMISSSASAIPSAPCLTGSLSEAVNHYGRRRRHCACLSRRFDFRGQSRSYLSAACAAPAGFPRAVFSFARASMSFADGRTPSSALTRSCKVSGSEH
jgi:hypothetical protein